MGAEEIEAWMAWVDGCHAAGTLVRAYPPPAQEPGGPRLEQQLPTMKAELALAMAGTQQAVSEAQRTVLGQVNSVDAKLNQRLDAVQTSVGQSLTSTPDTSQ